MRGFAKLFLQQNKINLLCILIGYLYSRDIHIHGNVWITTQLTDATDVKKELDVQYILDNEAVLFWQYDSSPNNSTIH